jgi:hypothetical protein
VSWVLAWEVGASMARACARLCASVGALLLSSTMEPRVREVCRDASASLCLLCLAAPPVDNGATIILDKKTEREVPRALILDWTSRHSVYAILQRVQAHM